MISVREAAVSAMDITAITDLIPKERWGQFGAFRDPKLRPFLMIKLGEEVEEPRWRGGPCQQPMQVWVHDTPGDYNTIDTVLRLVRTAFLDIDSQDNLVEVRYAYTSPDLEDDQLGTILRYSTFQWTLTPGG